jgi:hypothetical protein
MMHKPPLYKRRKIKFNKRRTKRKSQRARRKGSFNGLHSDSGGISTTDEHNYFADNNSVRGNQGLAVNTPPKLGEIQCFGFNST